MSRMYAWEVFVFGKTILGLSKTTTVVLNGLLSKLWPVSTSLANCVCSVLLIQTSFEGNGKSFCFQLLSLIFFFSLENSLLM